MTAPSASRSIGARHVGEKDEPKLIADFLAGLPLDDGGAGPVLVSFNGGGFDLPVLRYRALALGLPVPGLFHGGRRDYWYRFGRDHIDLCDMLSGFGASARPSLNEMAALLGVPAKLDGIDGSEVEAFAEAGRLDDIANYCLGDVITSFRLLLRFALVRGEIDEGLLAQSEHSLDEAIERQAKHRPSLSAMRQPLPIGKAAPHNTAHTRTDPLGCGQHDQTGKFPTRLIAPATSVRLIVNPLHPDQMTADERTAELGELLALGLMRLQA